MDRSRAVRGATAADEPTPARRQYLELKAQCPPDTVLLYRLGDFYETFDDDAHRVAEALHITLTSREFGRGVRVPLAGIPHHALNSYLGRLIAQGFKVAICEQMSEPGRGIIDRAVVRVVTPGTVSQPELLRPAENSYLAAVCRVDGALALAHVDVTTGEFCATEFSSVDAESGLEAELARIAPAECLLPASCSSLPHAGALTSLDDRCFEPEAAAELLRRRLKVASLEAFGCAERPAVVAAAGAVLAYLERTSPDLLNLLGGFHTYAFARYLMLDAQSRRNLDLLRSARRGSARGGLLALLDHSRTAMGGRLLRRFLSQPLLDLDAINARLDAVAALVADGPLRRRLAAGIERLGDAERLTGRVCQGTAGARECRALATILRRVPLLRREVEIVPSLTAVAADLDPVVEAAELIERAVAEEDGRLIRTGFDPRLDSLLESLGAARRTLLDLERRERERTGIRSLKIGYTKVFGYYIEVTRPNLKVVPSDYRHKQTLAAAERFVTAELRECEGTILQGEESAAELEQELFAGVLRALGNQSLRLLRTAAAIAQLDVYLALAEVAVMHGYVRPQLDESLCLEINAGRHPVVEHSLPAGEFIANDCALDGNGCQIVLVTGPNMAGKSTYLRQIALCTILAQMGSFVPAAAARIGLVDRIFTRIGAQDDISAGASTFLVEMIETAAILRHATRRSLVLLDEVGRGTGTQDGLAIAQAVIEYLHHHVGARTLFATHFHELIALAESLPRLRNFNVAAVEEAGRLVFLHRVQPGGSDRSYGVQVARLAGIPPAVAARAESLLRSDGSRQWAVGSGEGNGSTPGGTAGGRVAEGGEAYAAGGAPHPTEDLALELAGLDVMRMSPLEAMARLYELQKRAERAVSRQPSAVSSQPAAASQQPSASSSPPSALGQRGDGSC